MINVENEQLPISIHTSDEINALFPKACSACNKLEALFNFHTMTASWYGDEEQVLTLNLHLVIPAAFEHHINQAKDQALDHDVLSDDVYKTENTPQLTTDVFVAITLAEQAIIEKHPKVLPQLLETKLRKVLNLIAKDKQLNEI